jgi:hypothetical protein
MVTLDVAQVPVPGLVAVGPFLVRARRYSCSQFHL